MEISFFFLLRPARLQHALDVDSHASLSTASRCELLLSPVPARAEEQRKTGASNNHARNSGLVIPLERRRRCSLKKYYSSLHAAANPTASEDQLVDGDLSSLSSLDLARRRSCQSCLSQSNA